MQPTLVIFIKDGLVDEAKFYAKDPERAEDCFKQACLDMGASKEDLSTHVTNGYYQDLKSSTVCLVTPQILLSRY